VRASRAPWWFYFAAASILGFFTLQVYAAIWGPEWIGFFLDFDAGSLIAREVSPHGAGARAGLHAGDRIVAINGIPFRPQSARSAWIVAYANFETGRAIPLTVEREGNQIELNVDLTPGSLRDLDWAGWQVIGGQVFTLILALLIAFRRPLDPIARLSAWTLTSSVFSMVGLALGWASVWRHLPTPLAILLWPACITRGLISGLTFTFFATFPRKLFQARWLWILIWAPTALVATLQSLFYLRLVYQPGRTPIFPDALNPDIVWVFSFLLIHLPASLVVSIVQYRRLKEANEKRRMRVLFAGIFVCLLSLMVILALDFVIPTTLGSALASTPLPALLFALYSAGPVALAYAVLRHRVFDLVQAAGSTVNGNTRPGAIRFPALFLQRTRPRLDPLAHEATLIWNGIKGRGPAAAWCAPGPGIELTGCGTLDGLDCGVQFE
jgi:hypothetical protein